MSKNRTPFFVLAMAVIMGALGSRTVQFVGTLRISELVAAGCVVLLFSQKSFFTTIKEPFVRNFMLGLGAWAIIQLASDFHNGTSRTDIFKGHANFAFAASSFLFLAILFRNRLNVVIIYLLASGTSSLIFGQPLQTSDEILSNEYWDIRIGYWAGNLVLAGALIFVGRHRLAVVLGLLLYGGAASSMGGRSHGMIYICTAFALFLATPNVRSRLARIKPQKALRALVTAGLAICLMFPIYVFVGLKGLITDKAKVQLQDLDNPYNPVEVLLAGRYGIQYGIDAIQRRPIAGYGSRAYTGDYLPFMANRRLGDFDYNYIHSMYFEAWAFGGIGCGLCFTFLIFIMLRRCIKLVSTPDYHCVVVGAFVATMVTWHSLASPLASFRLIWPVYLAMTFAVNSNKSASSDFLQAGGMLIPTNLNPPITRNY